MKRGTFCGCVGIVLMAAGAKGQTATPGVMSTARGTVESVAGNGSSFVMQDRRGNEETILLDAGTKYLLGDEAAERMDVLAVGDRVTVELSTNNLALTVNNQNAGGRLRSADLKKYLGATDEDCELLVPLVAKVEYAKRVAENQGERGSAVRTAYEALRGVLRNANTDPGDVAMSLEKLRAARKDAEAARAKAQAELVQLLTVRQEAELVELGVIE